MLAEIGFVLAMVAVVVAVGKISRLAGLPDAVLLTVVGLVYALLPGPNLRLDPEAVLDLVIPPLLYNAALGSSLLALRSRLRTVVSLSVVLVLVTALVTGGLLAWLVPALPFAAAVALGAAVAPPDPVAALAVGRTAGMVQVLGEPGGAVAHHRGIALVAAGTQAMCLVGAGLPATGAGHLPGRSRRAAGAQRPRAATTDPGAWPQQSRLAAPRAGLLG